MGITMALSGWLKREIGEEISRLAKPEGGPFRNFAVPCRPEEESKTVYIAVFSTHDGGNETRKATSFL